MKKPTDNPSEIVVGEERFAALAAEPPATTSAERYVMSGARAPRLSLKEGELLLHSDTLGQIPGTENSSLGLYHLDTRYLSRHELTIAGRQPVLLSATGESGYLGDVELTNLESHTPDGRVLPQATVHVRRTRFLADRVYETLRVRNHHHAPVELLLDLHFDADFADLFEVRGLRRRRRGTRLAPKVEGASLTLAYLGLDEVLRRTVVTFADPPESIKQGRARHRLRLAPGESRTLSYDVQVVAPHAPVPLEGDPQQKLSGVRDEHERWHAGATDIVTDNEKVNRVLRRGRDDLRVLSAVVEGDRIALSGVPWFVAPFGRELAQVGLETLLLDLRWAQSAVDFLGRHQGTRDSVFREEQPGKIMHELRRGELANLRAVPHTPYYGSIDATPLWLLLVAELAMWSGDLDGFEARRASVDAALRWLEEDGDADGDGFVEYERRSRVGLRNQGWRDAADAVLHADGTPAQGPIALAETQGYVYYAKRRLAALFGQLGDVERAERLSQEARDLKRRF
ncbi:MAG: glycogen debranching N-terminal domain-containing protein, partial [Thermoleophilia bacterium]